MNSLGQVHEVAIGMILAEIRGDADAMADLWLGWPDRDQLVASLASLGAAFAFAAARSVGEDPEECVRRTALAIAAHSRGDGSGG